MSSKNNTALEKKKKSEQRCCSEFWDSHSFIALDIETTGLDPQRCEIIELGAVKFISGRQVDQFSVLVKPATEVPAFIKHLTGIRESDLEKGVSIKQALDDLLSFIKSDDLVFHNSSFDLGFIQYQLTRQLMPPLINQVFDTLDLSRIYLPFLNNHKLSTVADAFQLTSEGKFHRALDDALITGEIFVKLTEFVLEYIPFEINVSLSDIAEFAEQSSDLGNYFKQLVNYQRRFALTKNKAGDYHKLLRSPFAQSLGFNKSFNLIRTDDWYQDSEGNDDHLVFPEKEDDNLTKDVLVDTENTLVTRSFAPDGFFAGSFSEYEYREGQIEMSEAVDHALHNEEFLIVEAGTGIGKTLAYLVPVLHFANKKGQKVFISTNTKNLQEQLFFKDLPIIKKCLPIAFQSVILKGRENYLCSRKWKEIRTDYGKHLTPLEAATFLNLLVWQRYTRSGDISENTSFCRESKIDARKQYSSIWRKIAAERYFCPGRKCPEYGNCYYMLIRQKVDKSSLIVTNHSLLLTDLSVDRFGTDEENYLVIDEAHNLPDMAATYLGISLSYPDINNFFMQLSNINIRRNLQAGIIPALKVAVQKSVLDETKKSSLRADIDHLILSLDEMKPVIADFFKEIGGVVSKQGSFGKLRIKQDDKDLAHKLEEMLTFLELLQQKILNISQLLSQINNKQIGDYDEHREKLSGALEKAKDLIEALKILRIPDFDNFALWLSNFGAAEPNYPSGVINYAPLDVSTYLQKILYARMNSLIFTSATLSLRNSFKFFSMRMGLPFNEDKIIKEVIIPSPFDYHKQTLVLSAGYLPKPADEYFIPQSIELLKLTLVCARVGSMILFTSYKDLNNVYDNMCDELYKKDILLLAQGRGYSRTVTLNEFKDHGKAVLLGTNSFWEGVDVPGESLSLLILYKLPFQVPTEPLIEAYYEKLKKEGKDPFMYSTLPNAMLRFRQGFGRLIRNKRDRGVVLVVDSRVSNKYYGTYFREIIPTRMLNANSPEEVCDLVAAWFDQ